MSNVPFTGGAGKILEETVKAVENNSDKIAQAASETGKAILPVIGKALEELAKNLRF